MRKSFFIFLFTAYCLLLTTYSSFADTWTQTDWSGESGQLFYEDTTKYWQGSGIDGIVDRGVLTLYKEGIWDTIFTVPNQTKVYTIINGPDSILFLGSGDNTLKSIYRSIDNGKTWAPFISNMLNIVPTLLIAFSNLYIGGRYSTNTIAQIIRFPDLSSSYDYYLTVHDMYTFYSLCKSSSYLFGAGGAPEGRIYRSTDEGVSWNWCFTCLDDKIFSLLATNDGTVYAGTGDTYGRIYKSINYGSNWTETGELPGAKSVYSLTQGADSAIYAGTDTAGIVYKTTGEGNTWISTGKLQGATKVYSLICGPNGYLYAGCKCEDDSARIFASIDNGDNWTNIGILPGATSVTCLLFTNNSSLLAGTDYNGVIFKAPKFDTSGYLVSSIYNIGTANGSVEYGTILWDATADTQDIIVKVRTFQDTVSWSDTTAWDSDSCVPVANGQDISEIPSVDDGDQFVQYRVELSTQSPFVTPIFDEISINYSLDTIAPVIVTAVAYGNEELIPPDSIISQDRVIISFSEQVDTSHAHINVSNIDSILRLSNNHSWLDNSGTFQSIVWEDSTTLKITLGEDIWSGMVASGDTITPLPDSIKDKWGNPATSYCVITGSFAPNIDSIIVSDGSDSIEYIDNDDYVSFYFSKRTNKPKIDKNNINSVLQIPEHTWLDGLAELRGDSAIWDTFGFTLTCSLKIDSLRPTIQIGDTVFPDGITIWDKFLRDSVANPAIIGGTFGDYGPVPESAIAYEFGPPESGIGDGDIVWIFFNELIDTNINWDSVDLDTILTPQKNGIQHTWHPDSLSYDVQPIDMQDPQGIPYTVLYISFFYPGVEEFFPSITSYKLFQNFPNPFSKGTLIKYQISDIRYQISEVRGPDMKSGSSFLYSNQRLEQKWDKKTEVRPKYQLPITNYQILPIAIGDTLYPDSSTIQDFKGHKCIKPVVLQGAFKKQGKGQRVKGKVKTLNPVCQSEAAGRSQPTATPVSLRIYDIAGRLVRTLINESKVAGSYEIYWDGKDSEGRKVKSGIYFYKLTVGEHTFIRKAICIR
ncbi:hypothetical protein KAW65_03680 [candidate division WOR-3 bacterium]|nr:hypothetical protein [candidate division WOR-3 bacterium]